ncbi:6330_t:CDS:10 [Paraglomus brasilianum]|uniref:6330_t:CDS:1 n=1 Tax=Paraglomus brasilianum TaxID=144538 RepID=A0A9N9AYG7_9GLOM|nr:6330_t:CDS:10 [Paraglomus brasilianum]
MFYQYNGTKYLLNLIDTPGHVDFSYEVSRSLAACQGTLLLVDASQGIQAQTVANFFLAFDQGITVVPVINKIDLPAAQPDRVIQQIESTFELDGNDILKVWRLPDGDVNKPLRALLFDSWYDTYVGVVCLMAVVDGKLQKGDKLLSAYSQIRYDVMEVGIMHPEQTSTGYLHAGQVGYVICGMKVASEAHIGDTFYHVKAPVQPFPGFEPAKPMVFSGIFPIDTNDFNKLDESITKLTINDASVSVQKESRLGEDASNDNNEYHRKYGTRTGLENRLSGNITYGLTYNDGTVKTIRNPADFPDPHEISTSVLSVSEPMVLGTVILPDQYMGPVMDLCGARRGEQLEYTYIDEARVIVKYILPLGEIVKDFHDELKGRSSGYASFDYEDMGYREADIVKMNVLINHKPVDALAAILHRSQAEVVGREWARKLRDVIPKQLFEVAIQTAIGNKIIARETISALRKNVTAKCYGGDVTRKMKLLNKQKEGKKKLKMIGNVELPQKAFYDFLSKDKGKSK